MLQLYYLLDTTIIPAKLLLFSSKRKWRQRHLQSSKKTNKKPGKTQQKYERSGRMNRWVCVTIVENEYVQYLYLEKYRKKLGLVFERKQTMAQILTMCYFVSSINRVADTTFGLGTLKVVSLYKRGCYKTKELPL